MKRYYVYKIMGSTRVLFDTVSCLTEIRVYCTNTVIYDSEFETYVMLTDR